MSTFIAYLLTFILLAILKTSTSDIMVIFELFRNRPVQLLTVENTKNYNTTIQYYSNEYTYYQRHPTK